MNQQIKNKLAKIQELINRGSTEGERKAAERAFNRIVKENNIDESKLNELHLNTYYFTYSTELEPRLIQFLIRFFYPSLQLEDIARRTNYKKDEELGVITYTRAIKLLLSYEQYVTLSCSYEYFRRHMKKQYNKIVKPVIDRCRTNKTKKLKRNILIDDFFTAYIIASKLIDQKHVKEIPYSELSAQEKKNATLLADVEGGNYKTQVHSTHQLTN